MITVSQNQVGVNRRRRAGAGSPSGGPVLAPANRQVGPLGTTYEITQPPPSDVGPVRRRLERWKLQAVSRTLLPTHRVKGCCKLTVGPSVEVWRKGERAHYKGLKVCASVWVCPVCAAKITERRRLEVLAAMETAKAQGLTPLLLTLTFPHYSHDHLKPSLERFSLARRTLRNRRTWSTWAKRLGLVGSIRSLEVTHGANGWHVHTHELLFVKADLAGSTTFLAEMETDALTMWQSACIASGLPEPNRHGVTLEDGSKAASYASKWGLEHEMTKSHVKKGRAGGLTPWDMLREVFETGDCTPGELFQDYAKAFKGKRQLVWSDGLRDLLGLEPEMSDEEIAVKVDDGSELLGRITLDEWRQIDKANKRGELLEVATAHGWKGVTQFIDRIRFLNSVIQNQVATKGKRRPSLGRQAE